jgi:hypothetical protein
MRHAFIIKDQSLVTDLRNAGFILDQMNDQEESRWVVELPDDWNGTFIDLQLDGIAVVMVGEQLARAWEMDPNQAQFFETFGWVVEVPYFHPTEHPRYILDEQMFTLRPDGSIELSHTSLHSLLVPQQGRLVEVQPPKPEENQCEQEPGEITDPTELAKKRTEIDQMVRLWLSLSNVPGGDAYDASDLVREIVQGYECFPHSYLLPPTLEC